MQQSTISDRILELVRAKSRCTLEEVTQQLTDLHWSEVFLEVETLRRLGQLELNQSTLGWTTILHTR